MANKHYNKTEKKKPRQRKAPDMKWVIDSFSENKKAERRAHVRDGSWKAKKKKADKEGY